MAYFPNGSSGADYQSEYCENCIHDVNMDCTVWVAHLLYNYEECNKEDSILGLLIPRSEDGLSNEKCKMFYPIKEGSNE